MNHINFKYINAQGQFKLFTFFLIYALSPIKNYLLSGDEKLLDPLKVKSDRSKIFDIFIVCS